MKVGVLCEFSAVVRDEFIRRGHDAVSCDLRESERPGPHRKGDVFSFDWNGFDLLICHPPCTHLAVSGARWMKAKGRLVDDALEFVWKLLALPVERIALENPVSIISSRIRKPEQIIQPWQFGHGETKATCLWLKNLPKLVPTNIVAGRVPRVHHMAPGPEREREREAARIGALPKQWRINGRI